MSALAVTACSVVGLLVGFVLGHVNAQVALRHERADIRLDERRRCVAEIRREFAESPYPRCSDFREAADHIERRATL